VEFEAVVKAFCAAVEAGDGRQLAELFTPDGIYHDTFYGAFQGREAIRGMLEQRFHGDAERFLWEPRDMVSSGGIGYARWRFSYSSTLGDSKGKRVVVEGISCFELVDGAIRHYSEKFDSGIALAQLDFAPERMLKLFRRWGEEMMGDPALEPHRKG
jgi:ketosteroid isomerase-like protein